MRDYMDRKTFVSLPSQRPRHLVPAKSRSPSRQLVSVAVICTYMKTGRLGYTVPSKPFVLGHEFMGVVAALGADALDGNHQPLQVGQRVAVEPAVPCWRCEICEMGHPNLCPNHYFYGLFPEDGALREQMNVSARNCFPMPDSLSDEVGPLLETLGIAIHAIDLAKIRSRQHGCSARRRSGRAVDRAAGGIGGRLKGFRL